MISIDTRNPWGDRLPANNFELLAGFDFNPAAKLSNIFFDTILSEIDSATGVFRVAVKAGFLPRSLRAPATATHFQVLPQAHR
jgi:hypothetical protein